MIVFFLLFLSYPLIGWLAVTLVFIRPLKAAPAVKFALGGASLLVALKFLFYARIGGSMFSPNLPHPVVVAWAWLFAALMVLSGFAVALAAWRALRRLAARIAARRAAPAPVAGGVTRRGFVAGACAAAAAGTATHGLHAGMRVPDVKRVTLALPGLPAAFDGYRIVQLSDLHISSTLRAPRTAAVVDCANALGGDLVCITGDFVDGWVEDRLEDVRPLAGLKARDGVYGCSGNHEYYSDYTAWRPRFEEFGVQMLDNAHALIRRGADVLALGGLEDLVLPDEFPEDVFRGAPAGAFRVLLRHRPVGLPRAAAAGVKLQLSGHTHGGGLAFFRPLVAPINEGHIEGLYREHGVTLYVNPGTGQWAGCPMRLGNPSEITLFELKSRG